jgi:hypothetical protein
LSLSLVKTYLSTIQKLSMLSWKCNNEFPLHCCQATKHFVLLLTTVSINVHGCCTNGRNCAKFLDVFGVSYQVSCKKHESSMGLLYKNVTFLSGFSLSFQFHLSYRRYDRWHSRIFLQLPVRAAAVAVIAMLW